MFVEVGRSRKMKVGWGQVVVVVAVGRKVDLVLLRVLRVGVVLVTWNEWMLCLPGGFETSRSSSQASPGLVFVQS